MIVEYRIQSSPGIILESVKNNRVFSPVVYKMTDKYDKFFFILDYIDDI